MNILDVHCPNCGGRISTDILNEFNAEWFEKKYWECSTCKLKYYEEVIIQDSESEDISNVTDEEIDKVMRKDFKRSLPYLRDSFVFFFLVWVNLAVYAKYNFSETTLFMIIIAMMCIYLYGFYLRGKSEKQKPIMTKREVLINNNTNHFTIILVWIYWFLNIIAYLVITPDISHVTSLFTQTWFLIVLMFILSLIIITILLIIRNRNK